MVDSSFYKKKGPFTLKQISEKIECNLIGDENKIISDLASMDEANDQQICFLTSKYKNYYKISKAGAFIISEDIQLLKDKNSLISKNPHFDMAIVASLFYPESEYPKFYFSESDILKHNNKSSKICPNVLIHKSAKIGMNCEIGNNSVIGPGVVIGDNCLIGDNVSIYFSIIGDNAKIYQGVRLGSEGFGFIMKGNSFKKIPQLGRVVIGNHVEVGSNTTIDRGSIGDTIVGNYTMIDNIVHLGHNVKIGERCIIAAMTGISGSTSIGDNVIIGGQVGISGHLSIGNNVKIAAKTGVMKNIDDNSVIAGYPSEKISDWHRNTVILKKMRKK